MVDSLPSETVENPSAFLAPQEQETLRGLRFSKRRQDWLMGRWAAKTLLRCSENAYNRLPYEAITIAREPEGAPYFEVEGKRLPVCVSLSHRAGRAVCALGSGDEIRLGIDIEKIEHRPEIFVKDYFTAREISSQARLPESERDTWVTLAWSAKEAVFKALRTGLHLDTRSAEIQCPPDMRIVIGSASGVDGGLPPDVAPRLAPGLASGVAGGVASGVAGGVAEGVGDAWLPLNVAYTGDPTLGWWAGYQVCALAGGDNFILTLAAFNKGVIQPGKVFQAYMQPVLVKTGPPATPAP